MSVLIPVYNEVKNNNTDYLSNLNIIVDTFLQDRTASNLSTNSLKFYKTKLIPFLSYCESVSVKSLDQLTPTVIQSYLNYLRDKGLKQSSIGAYFTALKACLKWHYWYNQLDSKNPVDFVRRPKVSVIPLQPVTDEQIDKLLHTVRDNTFTDTRDRLIILLLKDTGLRASELLNIKIADIDFVKNSILIPHGKGNKSRYVFYGRDVRLGLNKFLKHAVRKDYLFTTSTGEHLTYSGLRTALKRMSLGAGLSGIEAHDFRRYFALKAIRNGMDLLTLSRILGHVNLAQLQRYVNQNPTDLQTAYNRFFS